MKTLEDIITETSYLDISEVRVQFVRVTRKTVMVIVHPEDRERTFVSDVVAELKKLGFRNVTGRAMDELHADGFNVMTNVYLKLGEMLK